MGGRAVRPEVRPAAPGRSARNPAARTAAGSVSCRCRRLLEPLAGGKRRQVLDHASENPAASARKRKPRRNGRTWVGSRKKARNAESESMLTVSAMRTPPARARGAPRGGMRRSFRRPVLHDLKCDYRPEDPGAPPRERQCRRPPRHRARPPGTAPPRSDSSRFRRGDPVLASEAGGTPRFRTRRPERDPEGPAGTGGRTAACRRPLRQDRGTVPRRGCTGPAAEAAARLPDVRPRRVPGQRRPTGRRRSIPAPPACRPGSRSAFAPRDAPSPAPTPSSRGCRAAPGAPGRSPAEGRRRTRARAR